MARKILLADDSVTAQNMGRKILTDAGYEVVTVNNGSAALKKIVECRPSLVVLDVYMPGYSGLEVCARIKEGRDTEGIPVLLTVGKLEPFRQDDARKVRADAYIIKPFEATELLAALNKLEAKSGRHESSAADFSKTADESKSSRHFAANMDSYERAVADGAPRFGDQESGWKARLTMPSPETKREEPEEAPEIATISSQPAQEWSGEANDRPAFAVMPAVDTNSSIAGLPNDVTPDELAAIAAAAAAVGGANGEGELQRPPATSPALVHSSEDETPAPATFASEAIPEIQAQYPVPGSSAGPVSEQVEAVFTSFAARAAQETDTVREAAVAPARETMAAVAATTALPAAGRWVAEEVPVEAAESALVLEREMHKAFAAFAAAEHQAVYEAGPVDKSDEPMFASSAAPAIGTPTPFANSAQEVAGSAPAPEPTLTVASPIPSSDDPTPPEIANAPAMPFAPAAAEEPKHAGVAFGEPHKFGAAEAAQPETAAAEEVSMAATPAEVSPTNSPSASLPDEWHDLRQPVAGPASASRSENVALEDFTAEKEAPAVEVESKLESAAMAAAAAGDSSSSGSTDATLSNIVDSMLAELKPKLMAELAKKLEKK
ncbi:MAG TPA: response regulator [Terriglobales bacterium]|nr:response regulator [Terriglobales bacterium]